MEEAVVNTSGEGRYSVVPDEVLKWNWGAFFLNFIWGIGNNTWRSFLVFIPVFNIFWIFALGYSGNKWAWQNKRWESIEQFWHVQRQWAYSGISCFVLFGFVLLSYWVFTTLSSSRPYEMAIDRVLQDERTLEAFGGSIEPGWLVQGSIEVSGQSDRAELAIPVSGATGDGTIYVRAIKESGQWHLLDLTVVVAHTREPIAIIAEGMPRGP